MQKRLKYLLLIFLIIAANYLQARGSDEWGSIALIHVTVIDATGVPAQSGMTVVITDSRITDISKDGRVKLPPNIRKVDASVSS